MSDFTPTENESASHEDELRAEGWERQFTADEPRLSESVQLFESIGYEVRVEEETGCGRECNVCFSAAPERYKVIYTRRKSEARDQLEELF
ncbi:MAG: hypothetical protein EPO21_16410 [Chloroflexota bacterium]|nr:MAG: hypothetical protein EPO21_16410 [Chloroflexota bacterium]